MTISSMVESKLRGRAPSSTPVMLPGLDLTPPITQWSTEEIAIDGLRHVVYAATTEAAYELLSRNR